MKTFDELSEQTTQALIGRQVVDERGEGFGTLEALWTDEASGKAQFLVIRSGGLGGKTQVVPARGAEVDEANDAIRLPYAAQRVKEAPSYPAEEELSEAQEREIYQYYGVTGAGAAPSASGATTARSAEGRPLRGTPAGEVEVATEEERLRVGKREVGAGRVRLRKVARSEQVQVPVELRREDVVVERIPADQVRSGERSDFSGKEVELELRREEPVVEKERVVTGAVRARKTEEVERQTVSDSVRKEDVEVERAEGEARAQAGGPATDLTGAEAERERNRRNP
ncbi:MAG: PRC and DUF2382 domain-containing protein [Verrucomicrobia bacterium]|nr:PRC and DUF2382 domain-containing protein [Verrucomicrobiota bacterium]